MNHLKENEWVAINDMLLELYSIDDVTFVKEKFLHLIRLLIPYSQASFTYIDRQSKHIDMNRSVFIDINEELLRQYNESYYKTDYVFNTFNYMKSVAYRDTDILDDAVRKKTTFYREFLLPMNVPYAGGLILVKDAEMLGVVTLFRSNEYGDLSDKDLFILDQYKNHLTNILNRLDHQTKVITTLSEKKYKLIKDFSLSLREVEIVELILSGLSNNEIGDQLMISTSTVKKHVYNIFMKFGVNSRSQLITLINRT
jgi:DNA-binding CsgD family transcriptional regulator